MSAYLQMGHDTKNLVGEKDLEDYTGIVLSPVNEEPDDLRKHIRKFRSINDYDIIFDSQLYFPKSERGKLRNYPYFPSDFDSTDSSSPAWWNKLIKNLIEFAASLDVSAIASPVIYPKRWNSSYYSHCAVISKRLKKLINDDPIRALTTVMVNISELTDIDNVMTIASIMSEIDTDGYYLIFVSDVEPRRELSNASEIFGMMCLINELKNTGLSIIVAHCSSDMILYKAAGAEHCSTGKFFNLRRFTKARYETPPQGGGQLPYWFEHSLMAFLREADLLRLLRDNFDHFVARHHSSNLWADEILQHFIKTPEKPWLGLSWRQYLSWFCKAESELTTLNAIEEVNLWLKDAEENWVTLDDNDLLFDETRNDGSWIRPWRQALMRFKRYSA